MPNQIPLPVQSCRQRYRYFTAKNDAESISEYAISAMQYAVGSGLMKGKTESTINPKDVATRAEIAAILQRFLEANK